MVNVSFKYINPIHPIMVELISYLMPAGMDVFTKDYDIKCYSFFSSNDDKKILIDGDMRVANDLREKVYLNKKFDSSVFIAIPC